jgi:hypothetical protein
MIAFVRETVGSRTLDAFLELAAAAEIHISRCPGCAGDGEVPEHFEAFRIVDGIRTQKVPSGRGTQWHRCQACGDLRDAIGAARGTL